MILRLLVLTQYQRVTDRLTAAYAYVALSATATKASWETLMRV